MSSKPKTEVSSVNEIVEAIDRGETPVILSNRRSGTALDEALIEAVEGRDRARVERLIADGADINASVCTMAIWASGDQFRTPLMAAASRGDSAIVRLLLEHGADPSVERELQEDIGYDDYKYVGTGRYESAADVAEKCGHVEIARQLRGTRHGP